MTGGQAPTVEYWHVWTDTDRRSRQERRMLDGFRFASIIPGTDPIWTRPPEDGARRTVLAILPAGVVGEWHENPVPQWIVVLRGRWFVETMDGQRVEMGPGELSFGGDQGTRSVDGRTGHRSGAAGTEPCVLLLVQFDDSPVSA